MVKEEGEDQGKNYSTGWWARATANYKEERSSTLESPDLPEDREFKEEKGLNIHKYRLG